MTIVFEVMGSKERVTLSNFRLVIAGYTGRDEAAVREHIEELAAIGIPAPDSVPTFYELDSSLVTVAEEIAVDGGNTSGEVEPILVRAGGRLFLGVGSDHTDRDIERDSVADSKAACAKPVGRSLIELVNAEFDWDTIAAQSSVDARRYQQGTLRSLRIPIDVLDLYDASRSDGGGVEDMVLFGGTLPLIGGEFIAGREWMMSLRLPDARVLELSYSVVTA